MTAFIDEQRGRFGVEPICRVLDVSASAYYQRASGERSRRSREDEQLLDRIRELHAANYYAYGSRRMWKALLRDGEHVGRSRVERLMRAHGIRGAKRRGKPWRTTTPDRAAVRHRDLVNRDFTVRRPDSLWVVDFTYLRCWEGPVFFAFVLDAYSRKVVGWQFEAHMRTDLVLDALRMALSAKPRAAHWTVIAAIAHNLARWTTVIGLPGHTVRAARTMRRRLLQIPGRLTRTARQWTLHLPARWPWQDDFTHALKRIRALPTPA